MFWLHNLCQSVFQFTNSSCAGSDPGVFWVHFLFHPYYSAPEFLHAPSHSFCLFSDSPYLMQHSSRTFLCFFNYDFFQFFQFFQRVYNHHSEVFVNPPSGCFQEQLLLLTFLFPGVWVMLHCFCLCLIIIGNGAFWWYIAAILGIGFPPWACYGFLLVSVLSDPLDGFGGAHFCPHHHVNSPMRLLRGAA